MRKTIRSINEEKNSSRIPIERNKAKKYNEELGRALKGVGFKEEDIFCAMGIAQVMVNVDVPNHGSNLPHKDGLGSKDVLKAVLTAGYKEIEVEDSSFDIRIGEYKFKKGVVILTLDVGEEKFGQMFIKMYKDDDNAIQYIKNVFDDLEEVFSRVSDEDIDSIEESKIEFLTLKIVDVNKELRGFTLKSTRKVVLGLRDAVYGLRGVVDQVDIDKFGNLGREEAMVLAKSMGDLAVLADRLLIRRM